MADLPIELIFRIFDQLDLLDLLISVRDVCVQWNQIIEIYHRFQVNFLSVHPKESVFHRRAIK